MVKVLVLFGTPIDRESFDQHFTDNHRPLILKLPNLQRFVVNRIAGAATGDSPFSLIAELHFASEEAMQEGLNSQAGQAMAADYSRFASNGVTVLFSHAVAESVDLGAS